MRPSFSYERSELEKLVLAERSEARSSVWPMLRQAQHEGLAQTLTLSPSKGGQPAPVFVALDGPRKVGHDSWVWGAAGASSAP
jgi:hypothetical protein